MIGLLIAAATGSAWPTPPVQAPWSDYWGKQACKRIEQGEHPSEAFKYVMRNQILGSPWEKEMVDFVKRYGPKEKWSEIATQQMFNQRLYRCPPIEDD